MKNASKNLAHPLDFVTYDLIYTNIGASPVVNAVLTDNMPVTSDATYSPGSASNGGVYNAASDTLVWTIPLLAPGASVTETYQMQMGLESSTVKSHVVPNNAVLNFPGGSATASTSVTVQGSYVINLSIYTSTGELVVNLADFQLNTAVSNFSLSNLVLQTQGQTTQIIYDNVVVGTWAGTNANGVPVSNGVYLVKINSTDPYGVTTTITKNVTVSFDPSELQIAVYNEAGERVKNFTEAELEQLTGAVVFTSADYNVGEAKISSGFLAPSATGGPNSTLTITLGSGKSFAWDGKGDNGAYLTNGHYSMVVESQVPGGQPEQTTFSFIVQGAVNLPGVVLAPNPVNSNQTSQARFLINLGTAQVDQVQVKIYTVAGELVQTLASQPGTPSVVVWDFTQRRIASGAYIAVVELYSNGGMIGHETLTTVVLH